MLKPLRKLLVPALLLSLSGLKAQTINYTSTPATSAIENVAFTTSIAATISNNDALSYSAPTLPSWLTLSSGGATSGTKINNSTITQPAGVAGDANGNFYVVQNSYNYSGIYKIAPDGTTTLWAQKRANVYNYGAIVIGNYLYVSYYSGDNTGIEKFDITQQNPTGSMIYSGHGFLSMTFKDGYLYAANYSYGKIGRINLSDDTYADYTAQNSVPSPFGLGFTADGDLLVACYGSRKIMKYSNSTFTDVITNLPSNPSDVKIDANGFVYVSFSGNLNKIRKYTSDFSSFVEVSGNTTYCWGMTLTAAGTLIYGDLTAGNVYTLQTGATLTGTPSHSDVGVHPVKVTVTNGSISKDLEFSITVTDPNPPTVETYFPAKNSTEIATDSTLHLVFSETIEKNSGKIFIKLKSDNSVLQTFDINDNNVTINDSLLSIKLGSKLPYLQEVYVEIESGAVKDVNDNNYAGISGSSGWGYTTVEQTQVEQTLTFAATKTVSYGVADFAPGATTDAGLDITYTSSDPEVAEIVNGKIRVKKPGVVTITANQAGNEDYFAATPATQELTINKKEIEVVLVAEPSIFKVYDGTTNISLTGANYQLQGVVEGDEVNVSGIAKFEDANAGITKTIAVHSFAIGGTDKDKYKLTTEETTVAGKIVPKKIQVVALDKTKVYGAPDGDFAYEAEGLLNDDQLTGSLTRQAGKNVGEYEIETGTLSAGSNYEIAFTGAKLTITPANLLIKSEDKTKQQGKANPTFTFSYEGLVNGDVPSALTTQPQAQTIAETQSPIGYYDIIAQGAASENYNISYGKGRLTIVPGESSRVKAWSSSPSVLQVRVYAEVAQKAALVLYTDAGQSIVLQRHQLNAGVNNLTINVGSLTPNVYILHVNADKFKESERVKIK